MKMMMTMSDSMRTNHVAVVEVVAVVLVVVDDAD